MGKIKIQTTLRAISVAFFLEALVLFVATVAIIWGMTTSQAGALLTNSALVVLTLSAGVWLTFAGIAITKGKRWARSAGVFWQLIQLAIALGTFEASLLGGFAIALPSLAVLFTLFSSEVVKATSESK
ncbi:MAG: hypothetical protein EBQ79_00295 [Actinobacteria bacterium]|jgi:hypothetical protein|nr:hypothetical protein [Actinomycetota bacterium]